MNGTPTVECEVCHAGVSEDSENRVIWQRQVHVFCARCRRNGDAIRALAAGGRPVTPTPPATSVR